jgi:maleate cis-trans isomerase
VRHAPPAAVSTSGNLADIEAQAHYHRDRVALYRARMHGSSPTSTERLRELERAAAAANERLRTARQADRERPA